MSNSLIDIEKRDQLVAILSSIRGVLGRPTRRQAHAQIGPELLQLADLGGVREKLEPIAVIGEDDQERVVEVTACVEASESARQRLV